MWVLMFFFASLCPLLAGSIRPGSPDDRSYAPLGGGAGGFVSTPVCPAAGMTTLRDFPHCDKYLQCVEGSETSGECPQELLYNPALANETQPCDLPDNLDATDLFGCSRVFDLLPCPAEGVTTADYAHSCDKYFTCMAGNLTLRQCPAGLMYNLDRANDADPCVPPYDLTVQRLAECYHLQTQTDTIIQLSPGSTCPTEGVTTFSDLFRCDTFYECVGDGSKVSRQCPAGQLYNPARAHDADPCDIPAALQVSRLLHCQYELVSGQCISGSPAPRCIGRSPYHLPDEGDDQCRSFYQCGGDETTATRRECPAGLIYNARASANSFPCEYPENVSCGSPATSTQGGEEKYTKVYNFHTRVSDIRDVNFYFE
ncbi:uncharacterized protein LOC127005712 [Eriocheir sinensis]|uniref:uncharacterized protein LOC127005712 n=1 Tax=Eriocheir sinensis TaxID=95602 RepID=UPI0021C6DB7A|nr:uncharacterized protein LOC127005712 [Eriocheir sinensis]